MSDYGNLGGGAFWALIGIAIVVGLIMMLVGAVWLVWKVLAALWIVYAQAPGGVS